MLTIYKIFIPILTACSFIFFNAPAFSGVLIGGSRVVFHERDKQATISVKNDLKKGGYLIQSWAETAEGKRTSDFVVTPPIYYSAPGTENVLRIISVAKEKNNNTEKLYYLIVKAVPAVDKDATTNRNSVFVATTIKLKIFYRPSNLKFPREKAEERLIFTGRGHEIDIFNPTPYWLTLTKLAAGKSRIKNLLMPPHEHKKLSLEDVNAGKISWNAITDHGGSYRGSSLLRRE